MSITKLEKLQEQEKKIQAQIKLLKSREQINQRKLDTRKKILIGAAMLSRIKKNQFSEADLMTILDEELVLEKDRSVFEFKTKTH